MLHWVVYQLVYLFAGVEHKEGHHSMLNTGKPDIKPTDVELIVDDSCSTSHDCDSSGSKITDCIAPSSINILPGQLRVWTWCWFNIILIGLIGNCHFQYCNIVAKSKSQYYNISIELSISQKPCIVFILTFC